MTDKPKLVEFKRKASEDDAMAVEKVLKRALKEDLDEVVLIGWCKKEPGAEDACLYLGVSTDNMPEMLYLIEKAKWAVMEGFGDFGPADKK